MTRLASRSPAAPFSTSRPAPMPQRPPQSTTNTEAQTLRQMVQEREEEIERLRDVIEMALTTPIETNIPPGIEKRMLDALDGGGDYHASS